MNPRTADSAPPLVRLAIAVAACAPLACVKFSYSDAPFHCNSGGSGLECVDPVSAQPGDPVCQKPEICAQGHCASREPACPAGFECRSATQLCVGLGRGQCLCLREGAPYPACVSDPLDPLGGGCESEAEAESEAEGEAEGEQCTNATCAAVSPTPEVVEPAGFILPAPIPDNGVLRTRMTINPQDPASGPVFCRIELTIGVLDHPQLGTLEFSLVPPAGIEPSNVILWNRPPCNPGCATRIQNLVFTTGAADLISAAQSTERADMPGQFQYTGRYQPMGDWSVLVGHNAVGGSWDLVVRDSTPDGQTGTLTNWGISVTCGCPGCLP